MSPTKVERMNAIGMFADFSVRKARKAQVWLAEKVITDDILPKTISSIAGVDAAYFEEWAFGAVAVLDYGSLEVLESQVITMRVMFPYVPTLLSFRELPVLASCIRRLKLQPDVFLVDGHGVAHPYGCGLACHLGVALSKPTVGIAKNRLIGEETKVGNDLFLRANGQVVAAVVQSVKGARPLYVSIGHMISLETSVNLVRHCIRSSRVPEPIRAAHLLALEERKTKMAALHN